MNWNGIDVAILAPAFAAGVLVLATHVPLGAQVLRKGIVFIDLAIAQIAALGVIAAGMMDATASGWQMQAAALLAAVGGALLLHWTERRWPEVQEAQIGVVFVLAATAGILLLAKNPHGGEHLRDLLAGQILWVSYTRLLIPLLATVVILALWFGLRERLSQLGFYLVFALAVTVSVQLVGVYLVFATLIVPSLGARSHAPARRLPLAYAIAALGYGAGLLLSSALDLPSGALIVWCLAALAVMVHASGARAHRRGDAEPPAEGVPQNLPSGHSLHARATSPRCQRVALSAGHSHAAPRTPDESPWMFFTIGVVHRSENTWRGSSAATSAYSSSMLDSPPPSTTTSGSSMLTTPARALASRLQ